MEGYIGDYKGNIMRVVKGDIRSLDYSSCALSKFASQRPNLQSFEGHIFVHAMEKAPEKSTESPGLLIRKLNSVTTIWVCSKYNRVPFLQQELM